MFDTREEAMAFRGELASTPAIPLDSIAGYAESGAPAAPSDAALPEVADGVVSEDYFVQVTRWLASENIAAVVARDDGHADRIQRAARTHKALVEALLAADDRRKLKRVVRELADWREKQLRAASDGTRLSTARSSGESPQRTVRRDDSIH